MNKEYNLCGRKYNRLLLLEKTDLRNNNKCVIYKALCDCGSICYVVGTAVKQGGTKSCGCLKEEVLDKRNKEITNSICGKYGRLTLIRPTKKRSLSGKTIFEAVCDCGNAIEVIGSAVKSGNINSCGCLKSELLTQKNKNNAKDLTGQKFGKLTVVKKTGRIVSENHEYECLCECGNITFSFTNQLGQQQKKSCGCLIGQNFIDMTGKQIGHIKVIKDSGKRDKNGKGQPMWECQCTICDKIWLVRGTDLRFGKVYSCGCVNIKTQLLLSGYLRQLYPNLEIIDNELNEHGLRYKSLGNTKRLYKMQLDIWIPSLKIAVEYQGECHFYPIFSQESFDRCLERDKEKKLACKEAGIKLLYVNYTWDKTLDSVKENICPIIDKALVEI